jgi:hypothetical protein
MDKDPFELEADIDATRELVKIVGLKLAEVFVYSGDRHLFADSSLPSYDADMAALGAALTSSSTGRATQDNDSTAVPSQHSPYPVRRPHAPRRTLVAHAPAERPHIMHDPVDTVLEGVRRFARSVRLNRQAPSVSKPRRSAVPCALVLTGASYRMSPGSCPDFAPTAIRALRRGPGGLAAYHLRRPGQQGPGTLSGRGPTSAALAAVCQSAPFRSPKP